MVKETSKHFHRSLIFRELHHTKKKTETKKKKKGRETIQWKMGKGYKEAIHKKDSNSQKIYKKMLIQTSNQINENLKQYTLELANI